MVSQLLETVAQRHGSDAHTTVDLNTTPPDFETQWEDLLRYANSVRPCPTSIFVYVPLSKHADIHNSSPNKAESSKVAPAKQYTGMI